MGFGHSTHGRPQTREGGAGQNPRTRPSPRPELLPPEAPPGLRCGASALSDWFLLRRFSPPPAWAASHPCPFPGGPPHFEGVRWPQARRQARPGPELAQKESTCAILTPSLSMAPGCRRPRSHTASSWKPSKAPGRVGSLSPAWPTPGCDPWIGGPPRQEGVWSPCPWPWGDRGSEDAEGGRGEPGRKEVCPPPFPCLLFWEACPWRAGDGEVGGGQSPTPAGTGKAPLAWNRSFPTEPLLRSQRGGGWCACAAGRAEGSGASGQRAGPSLRSL